MEKRKLLKITDNDGLIQEGERLYKAKRYGNGHTIFYVEVDPKEYDKRVEDLATKIIAYPQVSILDIIKDALYDMPLDRLDKLQSMLAKADADTVATGEPPNVRSKTANRGTCVDLFINDKYACNLRT